MGGNQDCHLCRGEQSLVRIRHTGGEKRWDCFPRSWANFQEPQFPVALPQKKRKSGDPGALIKAFMWKLLLEIQLQLGKAKVSLPALQGGGNWARIHPKSGPNGPTVLSTVMWPLWGYAKGGWKVIESMQEEVWSWRLLHADSADREASIAKDIHSQKLL